MLQPKQEVIKVTNESVNREGLGTQNTLIFRCKNFIIHYQCIILYCKLLIYCKIKKDFSTFSSNITRMTTSLKRD